MDALERKVREMFFHCGEFYEIDKVMGVVRPCSREDASAM